MTELVRPKMREEVEAVVGMDDHTLLHDPVTGLYHRLGSAAALLIPHLDGHHTTDEIGVLVLDASAGSVNLRAEAIDSFVASLHAKSLLAGDVPTASLRRTAMSRLMPRIIVSRNFYILLAPIARVVDKLPVVTSGTFAVVVAFCGYSIGFSTLFGHGVSVDRTLTGPLMAAVLIQLCGVLLHESWHGIIAAINGHPVRGLGLAMLFWVIPVAYVDRSDSYRVRSRGGRVAIAVAGMVSDGWICGITGLVAIHASGAVTSTAFFLLTFQLFLLIANLNPFLPSDTVSAIEAGTGLVDVRGRAFAMLKAKVGRQPLPGYLIRSTAQVRLGYLIYGSLSAVFAALVVCGFFARVAVALMSAFSEAR